MKIVDRKKPFKVFLICVIVAIIYIASVKRHVEYVYYSFGGETNQIFSENDSIGKSKNSIPLFTILNIFKINKQ